MTNQKETTHPSQPDTSLATISLVLGIISLTGPGLLLGIPAIITGSIALKKNQAGRGLSIAGLVTGIISTVVSLLFICLVIFLAIWGASHPQDFEPYPTQRDQVFGSSRT